MKTEQRFAEGFKASDPPSLAAPGGLSCSVSGVSVSCEWSAVSGAAGYEQRVDSGAWQPVPAAATSLSFTGVAGVTHTVAVRAVRGSAAGAAAQAQAAVAASAVGLSCVSHSSLVTCAASGPTAEVYAVTSWCVAPPAGQCGPTPLYVGVESRTLSASLSQANMAAGSDYQIKARTNGFGVRGPELAAPVTASADPALTVPGGLRLVCSADGRSVTATWDASVAVAGAGPVQYRLRGGPAAAPQMIPGGGYKIKHNTADLSAVVAVAPGTAYVLKVKARAPALARFRHQTAAYGHAGTPFSAEERVTCTAVPDAPGALACSAPVADAGLRNRWRTALSWSVQAGVTGYQHRHRHRPKASTSAEDWSEWSDWAPNAGLGAAQSVGGLGPDADYEFEVRARNTAGWGAAAGASCATGAALAVPADCQSPPGITRYCISRPAADETAGSSDGLGGIAVIPNAGRIYAKMTFTVVHPESGTTGVERGDLGALISATATLADTAWASRYAQIGGNAQVTGNALVLGTAQVYGNAHITGNAIVYGNARVNGGDRVYGSARVFGNARVYGNAQVVDDARVYGNARVFEQGRVSEDAWVYGNAQVYGLDGGFDDSLTGSSDNTWGGDVYDNARVHGDARIYGNARVHDRAEVSGRSWIYGNARVYGFSTAVNGNVARIHGSARVHSTITNSDGDGSVEYAPVTISGSVEIHGRAVVCNGASVYGTSVDISGSAEVCGIPPTTTSSGLTVQSYRVEIYDQARIKGNAKVNGNARVYGTAEVGDTPHLAVPIAQTPRVFGNARVFGDARIRNSAQVYGNAQVFGNAQVYGSAQVYGNAQIFDSARVYGSAQVYGNALVFSWSHSKQRNRDTGEFEFVFQSDDLARRYWTNSYVEGNSWNRFPRNVPVPSSSNSVERSSFDENSIPDDVSDVDESLARVATSPATKVYSHAEVYGDARVWGGSHVKDNAKVLERGQVSGGSNIVQGAMVCGRDPETGDSVWVQSESLFDISVNCSSSGGLLAGALGSLICYAAAIITAKVPALSITAATACFVRDIS